MKTTEQLTDEIAGLKGDKTKLQTGATMPTDLVIAGNTIFTLTSERDTARTEVTTEKANVTKLTGDKAKLEAGASIPTDLVSAGNSIAALTKERDDLKAAAKTTEAAVASKLVELGVTDAKGNKIEAKEKGQTMTEKCLAEKAKAAK